MKKTIVLFLCFLFPLYARADMKRERAITHETPVDIINNLQNNKWEKRHEQITKLARNKRQLKLVMENDVIKSEIIKVLNSEIKILKEYRDMNEKTKDDFNKKQFQKGYGGYVNKLINIVIAMKDLSNVPLLLECIKEFGSDEINGLTIINYGKPVLKILSKVIEEGNQDQKSMAIYVLAYWVYLTLENISGNKNNELTFQQDMALTPGEISTVKALLLSKLNSPIFDEAYNASWGLFEYAKRQPVSEIQNIKEEFRAALKNRHGEIRGRIAKYLGTLGDENDLESLEELLNDDYLDPNVEYYRNKEIKERGSTSRQHVYYVRKKAEEAIKNIKSRANQK